MASVEGINALTTGVGKNAGRVIDNIPTKINNVVTELTEDMFVPEKTDQEKLDEGVNKFKTAFKDVKKLFGSNFDSLSLKEIKQKLFKTPSAVRFNPDDIERLKTLKAQGKPLTTAEKNILGEAAWQESYRRQLKGKI